MNKEGVDKCFLMEFVHVMGKKVHTLEDFGDVGVAGSQLKKVQAAWISFEIHGMNQESGRADPEEQETKVFETFSKHPSVAPWVVSI